MSRFDDRIEQGFDRFADRVAPSPTAWETFQTRIAEETDQPEVEIIMLNPNAQTSQGVPRRTKMLAVAASLVLVVGGVIAIALWQDGSDDPAPVDQPASSTTIDNATTIAPVDTAALAATGARLMTALDAKDPDAVEELVADGADPISMFGASTKSELIDLFGWMDASDWQFELQGCEGREPNQAQCTVLQSNAWATAAGAEPAQGTLFMTINEGQVVAMRYGQSTSFTQYFEDFYSFVRQADPAAAEQMWATESDGRTVWPVLTDGSYELFEQFTSQYVNSKTE